MSILSNILGQGLSLLESVSPETLVIGAATYACNAGPVTEEHALKTGMQFKNNDVVVVVRRALMATDPAVGIKVMLGARALRIQHIYSDDVSVDLYLTQR